jgi:prevent-host-death family protein
VATSGYLLSMTIVSIKQARDRLTALARLVEKGETVVVTRNGRPIIDLVPHGGARGLNLAAGRDYLHRHGIKQAAPFVADDFDAPLPEEILLRPHR